MRLLLELSLEHPTLPRAEALATLEALDASGDEAAWGPGVLVVETEADAGALADRLGLSHRVLEHWATAEPNLEAIVDAVGAVDLAGVAPADATVALRTRRLADAHPELDSQALAREAGALLASRWAVDLDAPQLEVRVLVTADRAFVGHVVAEVDRGAFEDRHVKHRPYFSPVSLHPRMARAFVNLARVRPGDRVLDPFCGTGGIALEAGLAGAGVMASDLDARMVAGTRDALAHFEVTDATVRESDVGDVPSWCEHVDAVVTDPPYGRAATTDREQLRSLYARFLEAAAEVTRPGGWVVAAFPEREHVDLAPGELVLEEVHAERIHRSLARHVAVWRRG